MKSLLLQPFTPRQNSSETGRARIGDAGQEYEKQGHNSLQLYSIFAMAWIFTNFR